MTFDPDDYLAEKDFDPDEYLNQKSQPSFLDSAKDYGGKALHVVGQVVDHLGPAQIRNATAGMLGQKGTSLQDFADDITGNNAPSWSEILNKADFPAFKFTGDARNFADNLKGYKTTPEIPKEELDQIMNVDSGFNTNDLLGVAMDFKTGDQSVKNIAGYAKDGIRLAGNAIQSGAEKAAAKISPAAKKANADEIIKAGKELGIEITPGMLDDSGYVERLESSLAESPSWLGQSIHRKLKSVRDGLRSASQETLKDGSKMSELELGNEFKSGMNQAVHERLDPISGVFDDVAAQTKNIPLSERSLNAVQRNANSLDEMQMGIGVEKAQKYVDAIPRLKNADQVKKLMTLLNEDITAAQGAERQVLSAIKDKLSNLEKNSIMRSAIQHAKESGGVMRSATGEKIGADIVGDLKDARSGYRELATDLGGIAKETRIPSKGSPNQFLSAVENIPSEKIGQTFGTWKNNRSLVSLQEKFPIQFDLLRKGKLNNILEKSVSTAENSQGGFSTHKFLKAVGDLEPEAQQMLFGKDVAKIGNIKALKNAIPRDFNPSHTASQGIWQQGVRTVQDIPAYMAYKGGSTNLVQSIGTSLKNSPQMLDLSNANPVGFQKIVEGVGRAGVVNEVAQPKNEQQEILNKLQNTKYGKVLQNAAASGDKSFNAAHYILSQRDPEYRKHLEEEK
jgi:hypothetical protein